MIGRDAEVTRIGALIADARSGRSGTLLVTGEPGIGKTSLLAHARAEAAGMTVLESSGLEAEANLPFAGLAGVLRPVIDRFDELPAPQAEAVRGALGLGPLVPADAATIVRECAPAPPAADVLRRLVHAAGGNPLALAEAVRALSDRQLAGREPLPDPLPVGPHLRDALLRDVNGLPEATRRALLLAAADEGATTQLADALGRESLTLGDLEPAERVGIVRVDPAAVRFRHPLVRAAVYEASDASGRRSAHQAHAAAAGRAGEAVALDRRAWHLALAATGPDADVASELEEAAARAVARNAHAAATQALESAARLSPDATTSGRRLLAAGQAALVAGLFDRATALLEEAAGGGDPHVTGEATVTRGFVEALAGSGRRAVDLLVAGADAMAPVAPPAAAALLAEATLPCQLRWDMERARTLAGRAVALSDGAPPPVAAVARAAFITAHAWRGVTPEVPPELAGTLASMAQTGDRAGYYWSVELSQLYVLAERYDEALAQIETFVRAARATSAPSALPLLLGFHADTIVRLGRLPEARAAAAEAVATAADTGQPGFRGFALSMLARVEALAGLDAECRRHAGLAIETVDVTESDALRGFCGAALGLLGLAAGDLEEAPGHLEAVHQQALRGGLTNPMLLPYLQDLVEVQVRLGDPAPESLAELERQAGMTGASWPAAAAARCRGLLAPDDGFEAEFETALALHARTPTPIEEARTLLCHGERRRRARRMRDARPPLARALTLFEASGAAAWAERARRELRAAGARLHDARPVAGASLTPQELQVALAVAGGAANKEAAAALLISPKTVEYHLAKVYAKLGVHSRAELATRLAGTAGG